MKKKDRELFDNLVKDVQEIKNTQKKRSDFNKLSRQIKCGLSVKKNGHNGHEFVFNGCVTYYMHQFNIVSTRQKNKGEGVFVCKHCNVEMTRKLSNKEKEAIKLLGLE